MTEPRVSDERITLMLDNKVLCACDYGAVERVLLDLRDCRAALAQEREAREKAEQERDEWMRRAENAAWPNSPTTAVEKQIMRQRDRAEAACARMREALEELARSACTCPCHTEGGYCDQCCQRYDLVGFARAALSDTSGEKAAAVIRAARRLSSSKWLCGELEDYDALRAAVDALDAEREEKP